MSASENGPEATPSASAWPIGTMYPTANWTSTQSLLPTLGPSQIITGRQLTRPPSTTYSPSSTFAPSSTFYPTASGTPTTSPFPTNDGSTNDGSTTVYPTASGTPTTSPFPTYDGSTTVYPTASGTPTTSPFPTYVGSTSTSPTASGTPTTSPFPSTFYPTASGTPTVSPFPSEAVSQLALPVLNSKYSYEKTCSEFVEAAGQVDTEVVFTYLAESRGTSLSFLTELEKQLLDHASAAALACSNNSSLNIYRLAFPADESVSDATTCQRVHRDSESCWILQTRIMVTTDKGSSSLAKNTVLMDLREQLNDEVLLTKNFKDLTFSEYLGPDPVDANGMPIVLPTPQTSTAGNEALKYSAYLAIGLAIIAQLAFFGLVYLVRRNRKNSALLRDVHDKSTPDDVEVAELLSLSKQRLENHPLTANDSFENRVVVHQNGDDVESFNDEQEFFQDTLFREENEARGKSNRSLRELEFSRGPKIESSRRHERPSASQRQESQRSLSSTSSKDTRRRPSSSSTREGATRTSSPRSVSQRQREDTPRRTSSSRSEATPRKGEVSRSATRPSDSRTDQPSRNVRSDEASRPSPQRNIPQSVEIDLLDAPDDFSEINEAYHSSSRRSSPKEQSSPTLSSSIPRRSNSDARDGARRSSQASSKPSSERGHSERGSSERGSSERGERSYRSSSERGPSGRGGERRSTSDRGEDPTRRSSSNRKAPSSLLYGDPVELAKDRMAVAKAESEERRRRRRELSSSNDGSAKFDNVEIV